MELKYKQITNQLQLFIYFKQKEKLKMAQQKRRKVYQNYFMNNKKK